MNIFVNVADSPSDVTVFPSNPERIDCEAATRFMSFDLINIGEVKMPLGEELVKISWSGMLFGEQRKNERFVGEWIDPKEMQSRFSIWRNKGQKLHLQITETTVNMDVYMDAYTASYVNGYGDIEYSISFITAKELVVKTEGGGSAAAQSAPSVPQSAPPVSKPSGKTHTVKSGESLWSIAQKYYGNGSKWQTIYNANKGNIKNPNQIYVGQSLAIP